MKRAVGLRLRASHRRPARPADPPRQHHRDERRQLPARSEPRSESRSHRLIHRRKVGPAGQSAMAHASYVISARAMALGAPPLAWFCAAAWPSFPPPLTDQKSLELIQSFGDVHSFDFSNPDTVNLRVRLFSVTVRNTFSGTPSGSEASISMVTFTSAFMSPDK